MFLRKKKKLNKGTPTITINDQVLQTKNTKSNLSKKKQETAIAFDPCPPFRSKYINFELKIPNQMFFTLLSQKVSCYSEKASE